MKLTSEAIYLKQIVILQKAWTHSKCLFSVEWFPTGWLVHFFDGVENIKEAANNRCWIYIHLGVLRFVLLGVGTQIYFSER